jgi:mannose-6-phosphate isomerase-like protein (cupin superfamily)
MDGKMKSKFIITSFLVFTFACFSFILSQTASNTDMKEYTIENCVNEFNPAKTEETKVGFQYWFADKNFADGKTVKLSVVAPHSATHPPHKHTEDEFFFILEGTAEFYLDGKTKIVGPMTSLYCPSEVEHGIKNVGDSELKYLVIKKYLKK